MSLNHQESPSFDNNNIGQSPGCDPKTQTKRNSGLFGFLKWFKPTAASSRESIDNDLQNSQSSSCDSLNSTLSNGTVASFSYINPNNYLNNNRIPNKCIILGPETDTYKARLKQRDKRRENDKNLTLRKKYNLFFNRETLLKTVKQQEEENSRSLPLIMTRTMDEEQQQQKAHRRTNSESSKTKKAGAYLHVKGKRKAPQPPGFKTNTDTMSLRRKKRLAPPPPPPNLEKIIKQELQVEIISNDSLKLDHGILKPVKETCSPDQNTTNSPETTTSARSSLVEAPVSPRPWYKRTQTSNKTTNDNKYEPIERLPDVQFTRNSIIDLTATDDGANLSKKKHDEKRKSGMSFLTNISELDREATEIIKKEQQKSSTTTTTGNNVQEMPQFMRPKDEPKINTDSWVSPKRRSAKDLIAKFNAITNVTKVTVFGQSKDTKRDYFGRKSDDNKKQENLLETHRKRLEQIDQKKQSSNQPVALMKSESTSAIKPKNDTPKFERKSWNCPKCLAENEYWRIICHVCSTIKPYFDDLDTTNPKKEEDKVVDKPTISQTSPDKILERSKTQIGFSALANYNRNKKIEKTVSIDEKTTTKETENKNEERERLKKMLIEMKNSLPNRKSNILLKQNSRTSVIVENPDNDEEEPKTPEEPPKIAEILVGTSETIYENIKVKRTDNPKPIKVSSSAQTQITKTAQTEPSKSILKKTEDVKKPLEQAIKIDPPVVLKSDPKSNNFELMRPKDFESIYSDPNGQSPARIYANLARNDELSLFFNMPKQFNQIKTNLSQNNRTTDTIEVNRLLKRLESAIAKGELVEASNYAKELAQLKVNCSVIRQKPSTTTPKKQGFTIEMYVEDKISHRGPFPIEVTSNQTVAELKQQVEEEFEIPVNVQRWILGKELASDDRATLKDHNITTEGCPVFLYLVAPDIKSTKVEKTEQGPSTSKTPDQISPAKPDHVPKIVEVIPKVVDTPQKLEINKIAAKDGKTETKVSEVKITIENKRKSFLEASLKDAMPSSSSAVVVDVKPTVLDEDSDDYDSKTLKPEPKVAKEWECHLCTLLNPVTSNICAVCATVRQKEHQLKAPKKSVKKHAPQPQEATYLQLVNLDNTDLVENTESFECLICFLLIEKGQGVTLRECLHQFCKTCLAYTIEYNEDAEIKCPFRDEQYSCNIALQAREIKALVTPQIYEQYLAKSMKEAENKIGKSFHCKTPDCHGWCIFEDNVNEFRCPVCRRINCLTCQAIHTGMNCKQYQERMNQASEIDEDAKRTKEMVDEMVRKGEALTCPTCQVILMKKWGCDWVRCSMCKTEICWVTKGPRWGPGGKGDTSGGCQCGVNGVKCHPQCNYCH